MIETDVVKMFKRQAREHRANATRNTKNRRTPVDILFSDRRGYKSSRRARVIAVVWGVLTALDNRACQSQTRRQTEDAR